MQVTGRPQTARTLILEKCLLHAVTRNHGISIRALAIATERLDQLSDEGEALHLFHVQRVQLLQPDAHFLHFTFAQRFLHQSAANL